MFKLDDRRTVELEKKLKRLRIQALPFATRSTLNEAAFAARRIAQTHIRRKMVTRNKYTENSIRVEQTKTLNIRQQASVVGSIAAYMEGQEFGGTKRKKGSVGVAVATPYSAGESLNARPRTRLPRKPNKLQNLKIQRSGSRGKSRRQKNVIAIQTAANSGQKFVYLDLGRRKGLFRVLGGKRKPKVRMVWDLTHQSVSIPKRPWLGPATVKAAAFIPREYKKAIEFQLKRLGLA